MALDPVASTLINLARCRERQGRLAQAWADYQRASVLNQETPGAERRKALDKLIEEGSAALTPRLPRLKIVIPHAPPGLTVRRDGQDLPLAALGASVPVDPGSHEIVASAPERAEARRSVVVAEGQLLELTLELEPANVAPKPAVAGPPAPPPAPPPSTPRPDRTASSAPPTPTWVWISGGLGAALAVTGIAFRIDGAAAESRLDEACGEARRCTRGSYDPTDDNDRKNRDFALFAAFTAAGAAGVGAAVVGLLWPRERQRSSFSAAPWVVASGGGASLKGSFR